MEKDNSWTPPRKEAGQRPIRRKPINRQQLLLRPVEVEKLVEEGHPVRAIWELVGRMNLEPFCSEIESVEGVKNIDEIFSVPGVGAAFIGNANDLRHSMGVAANSPEVEAARQTILKACLAHNVACGITVADGADMTKRLKEGWKMIRGTVEIIRDWRALQR